MGVRTIRKLAILLLAALLAAIVFICIPFDGKSESVVSDEIIIDTGTTIIEATPTPKPRKVHIEWEGGSLPAVITEGTQLKIVSKLYGFEDVEAIEYQWQVNRHDDNGFVDLEGETKSYLVLTASRDIVGYDYRLVVNITPMHEENSHED